MKPKLTQVLSGELTGEWPKQNVGDLSVKSNSRDRLDQICGDGSTLPILRQADGQKPSPATLGL